MANNKLNMSRKKVGHESKKLKTTGLENKYLGEVPKQNAFIV